MGKGASGFAPQLHESAGGLPKTKLVSHSCSLAGSTSAMEVSIPIAFVLPGREHECNESFKLGRPPAFSLSWGKECEGGLATTVVWSTCVDQFQGGDVKGGASRVTSGC
ncbi:hypothetical protein Tco_0605901 [Tanacetum coccineum]